MWDKGPRRQVDPLLFLSNHWAKQPALHSEHVCTDPSWFLSQDDLKFNPGVVFERNDCEEENSQQCDTEPFFFWLVLSAGFCNDLLICINVPSHDSTVKIFHTGLPIKPCNNNNKPLEKPMWAAEWDSGIYPLSDDSHGAGIPGMPEWFSMEADFSDIMWHKASLAYFDSPTHQTRANIPASICHRTASHPRHGQ